MPKKKVEKFEPQPAAPEAVKSIKGFDRDLRCRDYQFAIGETYLHDGPVVACESGFHAVEGHPLEVFDYYPPASSRYADVTQSGALARHSGDGKIASARIMIDAELHLPEIIQRTVKWVFDRANWKDGPVATGANEGATASGDSGAATASGFRGAATASGQNSVAMASGHSGRVFGKSGTALFLTYRNPQSGEIEHVWAAIAGRGGIKSDTWYTLDGRGKPRETTQFEA